MPQNAPIAIDFGVTLQSWFGIGMVADSRFGSRKGGCGESRLLWAVICHRLQRSEQARCAPSALSPRFMHVCLIPGKTAPSH